MGSLTTAAFLAAYLLYTVTARCPTGLPNTSRMTSHNGRCYQFVSDSSTWTTARDYCWNYGGALVTVNDADTNRFLLQTLDALTSWDHKNGVWIGLNDREDDHHWRWVTNDADVEIPIDATWTNWPQGHPKTGWRAMFEGDCVRMKRSDGWRWHESKCYSPHRLYRFICQYDELSATITTQQLYTELESTTTTLHESQNTSPSQDQVSAEEVGEVAATDDTKLTHEEVQRYVIVLLSLTLVLFVVACLGCLVLQKLRKRNRKRNYQRPPSYEECVYEDIPADEVSGDQQKACSVSPATTTSTLMQTSIISEGRMSNMYVEPDMQTSKYADDVTDEYRDAAVCHGMTDADCREYKRFDSDGYMEPKECRSEIRTRDDVYDTGADCHGQSSALQSIPAYSEVNKNARTTTDALQLSDTYLTVTPLTSPSHEQVPLNPSDVAPAYANQLAYRKLPDLPEDYMPMK